MHCSNLHTWFRENQMSKASHVSLKDRTIKDTFFNLQLSINHEISSRRGSSVNCFDIDRIDHRYVLSGAINGLVSLYDFQKCVESNVLSKYYPLGVCNANSAGFSTTITSVQWYPQDCGLFISSNLNGEILIYDTNTFTPVTKFTFNNVKVYGAKFRPSESQSPLIAAGLDDGNIHLCDLNSGDSVHIINGHSGSTVTCVDWSPIHSYQLCSSSKDGTVRVSDIRMGSSSAGLLSLDWRQDHTAKASLDHSRLRLLSPPVESRYSVAERLSYTVGININSSIVSSSGRSGNSGVNRNSNVGFNNSLNRGAPAYHHINHTDTFSSSRTNSKSAATTTKAALCRAHDSEVMSMRYTPDGNFILTAGNDSHLRLWSAHSGKLQPNHYNVSSLMSRRKLPYTLEIAQVTSKPCDDVILFPDNSLSSGGSGGNSKSTGGGCGSSLTSSSSSSSSSSGQSVALRSVAGDINLFPVHTGDGNVAKVLKGHLGAVAATVYRKPYQQVISAGRDNMMFVWDCSKHLAEKNRRVVNDDGGGSFGGYSGAKNTATSVNVTSSSSSNGRLNKRQFTGYSYESDVQQSITAFTATSDNSTAHRVTNRPHVVDTLNMTTTHTAAAVEIEDCDTWSLPDGGDGEDAISRNQSAENGEYEEGGEIQWDEHGNRVSNRSGDRNNNSNSNRQFQNRSGSGSNGSNDKNEARGKARRSALSEELRQYLSQDVLKSAATINATVAATEAATAGVGGIRCTGLVDHSSRAWNSSSSSSNTTDFSGGGVSAARSLHAKERRDVDWDSVDQIFATSTSTASTNGGAGVCDDVDVHTTPAVLRVRNVANNIGTINSSLQIGDARQHDASSAFATSTIAASFTVDAAGIGSNISAATANGGNAKKKKTIDNRALIMKQLNKRTKR